MNPTTISDVIDSIIRAIEKLEDVTNDGLHACREYSLTNTKLQEAVMWADLGKKRQGANDCEHKEPQTYASPSFLKQKNEEETQ